MINPVTWLVGHSNKAPVIVDRQETTTLIDVGAQVSSISTKFCKDLALQIQPLGQLLELEGTGGAAIPYLRFVEVNLQILGIRNYNEDVLLLVIPTMTYSDKVLVMVGSKIIVKADDYGITCKSDHDMATSSLWSSHVRATATIPCQLSIEQGRRGGKMLLSRG